MNDGTIQYVDEYQKPLPARDTWNTLSVDQLIGVKSQLIDMWYTVKSDNKQAQMMIQNAIAELDGYIK